MSQVGREEKRADEERNGETEISEIASLDSVLEDLDGPPEVAAGRLAVFPESEISARMDDKAWRGVEEIEHIVERSEQIGLPIHADEIALAAREAAADLKKTIAAGGEPPDRQELKKLSSEERALHNMKEFLSSQEGKEVLELVKDILLDKNEGGEGQARKDLKLKHFEYFKRAMELMLRRFNKQFKEEKLSTMPTALLWEIFDRKTVRGYMESLHRLNDNGNKQGYFKAVDEMGGDFFRIKTAEGTVREGIVGEVLENGVEEMQEKTVMHIGDVERHGEKVSPMAYLSDQFIDVCEREGKNDIFIEMDKFLHGLKIRDKAVGLGKLVVERNAEGAEIKAILTNTMKLIIRYREGDKYVVKCVNFEYGKGTGSPPKEGIDQAAVMHQSNEDGTFSVINKPRSERVMPLGWGKIKEKGTDKSLEQVFKVPKEAMLIFCTDGPFEVEDENGELYGDKYEEFCVDNSECSNDDFFQKMIATHTQYREQTREGTVDDATMICVKI